MQKPFKIEIKQYISFKHNGIKLKINNQNWETHKYMEIKQYTPKQTMSCILYQKYNQELLQNK